MLSLGVEPPPFPPLDTDAGPYPHFLAGSFFMIKSSAIRSLTIPQCSSSRYAHSQMSLSTEHTAIKEIELETSYRLSKKA